MRTFTGFALFLLIAPIAAYSQFWVVDTFRFQYHEKTPAHPFYGMGDATGYTVNGIEGGTIHMVRDSVYAFVYDSIRQDDSPILTTSARGVGFDEYKKGWIGENSNCNCIFYRLPTDAPDTLYYASGDYSWAGGMILVVDSLVSSVEVDVHYSHRRVLAHSTVTPNPLVSTGLLSFTLTDATELRLEVYDVLGRVVQSMSIASEPGPAPIPISREGLSAGIYFYRVVEDDGELLTTGSFHVR